MNIRCFSAGVVLAGLALAWPGSVSQAQEVTVFGGTSEVEAWLVEENWWGEDKFGQQELVPRALITGINARWRETAKTLTVEEKKEIFYRFLLPLALHANEMVIARRASLTDVRQRLESGGSLDAEELEALRRGAVVLGVLDEDSAAALDSADSRLVGIIDELLYRLDVIPAGLVLGQAAYESGYATSRFAVEGNALFGQWTYGGKGMVPGQQRKQLGDHRIASFDWPFDSVRAYFINLSSHPAYEDFRKLRSELRARGEPVSSLALADGLRRYSERGQEYVDTLKGIIRTNRLDLADSARFRDEPLRLLVVAANPAAAQDLRAEIEQMRESGELEAVIESMRLE